MYFLYVFKICILTLLKIIYETSISLLFLSCVMPLVVLVTKDKAFFTKQYIRFRKAMGIREEK